MRFLSKSAAVLAAVSLAGGVVAASPPGIASAAQASHATGMFCFACPYGVSTAGVTPLPGTHPQFGCGGCGLFNAGQPVPPPADNAPAAKFE